MTQPARSRSGESAGDSDGPTERDMLNAVYKALLACGLIRRTTAPTPTLGGRRRRDF